MQKIKDTAILLSAYSKPYDFNGRKGISNVVRFNINGEIYSIKVTADDVKKYSPLIGEKGEVTLVLNSPKERCVLSLESFVV